MKEIQLTQGKVALVDDEDYERLVAMGKWQFSCRYARKCISFYKMDGRKTSRAIFMHREIMNIPQRSLEVDHIDGNPLNNQKINLRICSHRENMKNRRNHKNNTSGFRGVTWNKNCKRWQSCINGTYIGVFICPVEAARAYNEAALKYHGEFAKLNPL